MTNDGNKTKKSLATSSTLLYLGVAVFVALGIFSNPLCFSGAMLFSGALLIREPKHKLLDYLTMAFAVIFFLFVFGYGIGKDLAERDNKVAGSS